MKCEQPGSTPFSNSVVKFVFLFVRLSIPGAFHAQADRKTTAKYVFKKLLNMRILTLIFKHSIHYFLLQSGGNILLYIKEWVQDSEKKRNAEKFQSKKPYLIK